MQSDSFFFYYGVDMKTFLLIIVALLLLSCGESAPVSKSVDEPLNPECCDGTPGVLAWDIYPPVTDPGFDQGVSSIPVGDSRILITFSGEPCNVRVTNLPGADWLIHKWFLTDTVLYLHVFAGSPTGLVHAAVDWHSGGKILKYRPVSEPDKQ